LSQLFIEAVTLSRLNLKMMQKLHLTNIIHHLSVAFSFTIGIRIRIFV